MRFSTLAVMLLALPAMPAAADGGAGQMDSSAVGIMKSDGLTFLRGAGYVLSAPVRWNSTDWMTFGAAGAGTAAAAGLDIDARLLMQRNRSPRNEDIARAAEQYGVGLNMMLLSAGGYIAGLVFDDRWIRQTSLLAGSAILIAASVSTVSKIVIGRARPYTGKGHMTFRPFSFTVEDYASFPSGHTIVAFAFSGVLAARLDNTWASIGLYALAASCGLSRMYTDEHWISDVVFGGVISVSVSRSLVRWFESGDSPADGTGLRLVPGAGSLTLVYSF